MKDLIRELVTTALDKVSVNSYYGIPEANTAIQEKLIEDLIALVVPSNPATEKPMPY